MGVTMLTVGLRSSMEARLEEEQPGTENPAVPAGSSSSLVPPGCLVKVMVIFRTS